MKSKKIALVSLMFIGLMTLGNSPQQALTNTNLDSKVKLSEASGDDVNLAVLNDCSYMTWIGVFSGNVYPMMNMILSSHNEGERAELS